MSIELLPFDTSRCSLTAPATPRIAPLAFSPGTPGEGRGEGSCEDRLKRPPSPARVAANRRNAKRSTGPRTVAGKQRASRNALKHGLCARFENLPSEDGPTFNMFLEELRADMRPRKLMQRILFPQIANLIWRLQRLPEAQTKIFKDELKICADGETISPAEVIARRFSADPRNGFLLLGRYERSNQSMLLRLLAKFDKAGKESDDTGYDRDEPKIPREEERPAWDDEKQRQQEANFARRRKELEQYIPPKNKYEAGIDHCIELCDREKRAQADKEAAERSQSKPSENRDSERETRKSASKAHAPVTKRSQRDRVDAAPPERLVTR